MARYRIKAVSRMLGVRPELLRMWEKRYHLFKPQRAGNRYREFDDEDVQLLRYICQQIDQGRAIDELSTASEHLATVILIQRLLTMLQATSPVSPAPILLCACPSGERHELGLLTFAYTMQQAGWHVYYLGSDLPLGELYYACQHLQPALVALSLTHIVDQHSCLEA